MSVAASAAEQGGAGEALVGRRVKVEGLGEGTVTAFVKSKVGGSAHTVVTAPFPVGAGTGGQKVKLARKGNGKTQSLGDLGRR